MDVKELPTEDYTIIITDYNDIGTEPGMSASTWMRHEGWWCRVSGSKWLPEEELAEKVTVFKVLAKPTEESARLP